jgi:hypothetical protein
MVDAYEAFKGDPLPSTSALLDGGGLELLDLIRKRIGHGRPLADIAAELGCSLGELVAFCETYREPPTRAKGYQSKHGSPISTVTVRADGQRSSHADAQRFANWRREHEGAREALGNSGQQVIPANLAFPTIRNLAKPACLPHQEKGQM